MLLAAGLALLMLSWVFANPPGAAPDERAHYVRALGAGSLELAGATFRPTAAQRAAFAAQRNRGPKLPGAGLATVLWAGKQTRTFALPADLSVFAFGCNDRKPTESAACTRHPSGQPSTRLPTYTGTYPPWPYVVPGAAMRAEHSPDAALRAGRAVSAVICFALLAAAILLLGPTAGLAIAMTPMAVYCATILNASGTEIAGSICFVAAGLRIHRRGAWLALAAGGVALTLSRSLGPVLLIVLGATLIVLNGRRGRPSLPVLAALAIAFVPAAWWDVAESPHGVEGGPSYGHALKLTFEQLGDMTRHAIGDFGALDTTLPAWLYIAWTLAAAGLLVLAFVAGTGRQRAGLALTLAVAAVITVGVSVFQLRTGFSAQGRHVLPVLVLPALYAGEVVRGRSWPIAAAGVLWAVGQAVAWLANARRGAVGTDGSWWPFGAAEWSPPLGWTPWLVLAAAGIALALAGYLSSARRARSMPPSTASAAT